MDPPKPAVELSESSDLVNRNDPESLASSGLVQDLEFIQADETPDDFFSKPGSDTELGEDETTEQVDKNSSALIPIPEKINPDMIVVDMDPNDNVVCDLLSNAYSTTATAGYSSDSESGSESTSGIVENGSGNEAPIEAGPMKTPEIVEILPIKTKKPRSGSNSRARDEPAVSSEKPVVAPAFLDKNLKVSNKVLASFLEWNTENCSTEVDQEATNVVSMELDNETFKVDNEAVDNDDSTKALTKEVDTTSGKPSDRFDLSRSYSSDEDDKYTGLWTPETEKYWALQYSSINERLSSTVAQQADESTNNNVTLEMYQTGGNDDSDGKMRDLDPERPRPPPKKPQRSYRNRADRVLYWLCASTPQPMDEAYANPRYRAHFTAQVLAAKAFQCFLICGALIGLQYSEAIEDFHKQSFYLAYISIVCYIFLFIVLRASIAGETNEGSLVCLLISTLLLIEVFTSLQFNTDPVVVCGILMILGLTFLVVSAVACIFKMDIVDSNNIYPVTALTVFLITSSGALILFSTSPATNPGVVTVKRIGGIFIPVLMSCESLVFLELSELYQIERGYRMPLTSADWLRATARLL